MGLRECKQFVGEMGISISRWGDEEFSVMSM